MPQLLDIAELRANPLLRLELQKPTRVPASSVMLWSAAICVASIFVGIYALLFNREGGLLRLVFGVWCLIALAVPPFVVLVTAQIAQHKIATDDFDLMYMTPLSNRQLAQWLIVLGLQHSHNLIRVVMGVTPILIVVATYLDVYQNYINCVAGYRSGRATCDDVTLINWVVIGTLIHYALLFINVWLGMLSAATVGLMLSVWSRGSYVAHYVAAVVITVGVAVGMLAVVARPLQEAFRHNFQLLLVQVVVIGACSLAASAGIRRSG
jgi:hypothetical protein